MYLDAKQTLKGHTNMDRLEELRKKKTYITETIHSIETQLACPPEFPSLDEYSLWRRKALLALSHYREELVPIKEEIRKLADTNYYWRMLLVKAQNHLQELSEAFHLPETAELLDEMTKYLERKS